MIRALDFLEWTGACDQRLFNSRQSQVVDSRTQHLIGLFMVESERMHLLVQVLVGLPLLLQVFRRLVKLLFVAVLHALHFLQVLFIESVFLGQHFAFLLLQLRGHCFDLLIPHDLFRLPHVLIPLVVSRQHLKLCVTRLGGTGGRCWFVGKFLREIVHFVK